MGYRVAFELQGEMPLLMHWDNIEGADELKEWRSNPKNKNLSVPGDDRSPAFTWTTYLYTDGEYVTMPSDNVMAAVLAGAMQVPPWWKTKKQSCKELSQTAILMPAEHLEFEFGDGLQLNMSQVDALKELPFGQQVKEVEKLGFRLFCKRAKVGQSKHVRVRPRFDTWRVRGELLVVSDELPLDKLQMIFDYAGRAGLCDWRPSSPKRPGPYGMFVTKLKQLAD